MSEQVREMYVSIAPRYDLTNVVLSFGVDRRWRRVCGRAREWGRARDTRPRLRHRHRGLGACLATGGGAWRRGGGE